MRIYWSKWMIRQLMELNGWDRADLAERLGCSVGRVKQLLSVPTVKQQAIMNRLWRDTPNKPQGFQGEGA